MRPQIGAYCLPGGIIALSFSTSVMFSASEWYELPTAPQHSTNSSDAYPEEENINLPPLPHYEESHTASRLTN